MKYRKWIVLSFFLCGMTLWATRPPKILAGNKRARPSKIIRTCCAFGFDMGISGIPFKKISEVTTLEKVGHHKYLGDKREGNGIIYTHRGGFIDLGHLRDIADWTGYLFSEMKNSRGQHRIIKLGREGGKKTLVLDVPADISDEQIARLAATIAYDLSLWHEIGTWFGTSYIPFVPERYSAFSPEDQYSNLLGANLGVQAVLSRLPYEEAMTQLIDSTLQYLQAVPTQEQTLAAMEKVEGDWWTKEIKLPSKNVLLKRYISADRTLIPWTVGNDTTDLVPISVPASNDELQKVCELNLRLNSKIPINIIFPERDKDRCISQRDFPDILNFIRINNQELEVDNQALLAKINTRKERKAKRKQRRAMKK